MYSNYADKDITVPYEEEVNGFTIYIEDNPLNVEKLRQEGLCQSQRTRL